jgi:hypothetical protein
MEYWIRLIVTQHSIIPFFHYSSSSSPVGLNIRKTDPYVKSNEKLTHRARARRSFLLDR